MPSQYLSQQELSTYEVPDATANQIASASTLVDAYLRRPEGLQYNVDYAGLPCYMAALSPSLSLPLQSSISPGLNVSVPIVGAGTLSTFGSVGDVVIIDRASTAQGKPGVCEACVIGSVTPTAIVLNSVANAHSAGVLLEFGLIIREQKSLPPKRSIVRLGSWPVVRIHSGLGSYRYGRRNEQNAGLYADQSVLALMQTFGGPPEWIPWAVTAADFSSLTNEVWIPSGIFLAYYSDVRVFYVAGFTQANIPPVIKQAVAAIITAKLNTDGMQGGLKMAKAGDTAMQRFENSVLDEDMRVQLAQYRARVYV